MRVFKRPKYSLHLRVDGQGLRRGDHQLRHLAWRKSGGEVCALARNDDSLARNDDSLAARVGSLGGDQTGG